jgi:hypothetical protein
MYRVLTTGGHTITMKCMDEQGNELCQKVDSVKVFARAWVRDRVLGKPLPAKKRQPSGRYLNTPRY